MGLETGTTIAQLDEDWPLSTDNPNQGDDHLKLIKSVLKAQFPGKANNGYAEVINTNETELNYLAGTTSNVQSQLNSLSSLITTMQAEIDSLTARVTVLENA